MTRSDKTSKWSQFTKIYGNHKSTKGHPQLCDSKISYMSTKTTYNNMDFDDVKIV